MSRPHNLLTILLGRPAASFTVAELDALPMHTEFGGPGREPYVRVGARWLLGGRAGDWFTSEEIQHSERVCIAVGEPDGGHADLADWDRKFPRPTKSLREIAAEAEIEGIPRPAAVRQLLDEASTALDEWVATGSERAHGRAVSAMDAATLAMRAAR